VDLGTTISPEFYQAVAEILAFVYHLNAASSDTGV
jgi:type III secretion system FlhB-like substrate exporter